MDTETTAEASREGKRPKRQDRCVQRTVDLSDGEIAAVEAAEMPPQLEDRAVSTARPADA
jgi:hypothetical protein